MKKYFILFITFLMVIYTGCASSNDKIITHKTKSYVSEISFEESGFVVMVKALNGELISEVVVSDDHIKMLMKKNIQDDFVSMQYINNTVFVTSVNSEPETTIIDSDGDGLPNHIIMNGQRYTLESDKTLACFIQSTEK